MMEVAVRIYGADREKSAAAKSWLETIVPEGQDDALARATERWEQVDSKPRRFPWKVILQWAAVAMAAVLWFPAKEMREQIRTVGQIGTFAAAPADGDRVLLRGLDFHQKLLIGDPAISEYERAEALYQSDPDNPAFLAEWAAAHQRQFRKLPENYAEEAERIDPDNAWFGLYAAAVSSEKVVTKVKAAKGSTAAPSWKINDEAGYRRTLDLFGWTVGKERFESYTGKMVRERIALLPQSNKGEWFASVAYLSGTKTGYLSFLGLSRVLAARAHELGESGDVEGLRELRKQVLDFVRLFSSSDDPTLVCELVVRAAIQEAVENLHEATVKLGIDGEEPRIAVWSSGFDRLAEQRKERKNESSDVVKLVERKGGVFASITLPVTSNTAVQPPTISEKDLAPGRLSDHAMLSKIFSAVLWLQMIILMALVFAYRYRAPLLVRTMALRVEMLLRAVDWCWILGAGVLLPGVVLLGLIAFTPFGGRDHSMSMSVRGGGVLFPAVQFQVLSSVIVIMSVLMSRWRLRVRGGVVFRFRMRWVWAVLVLISSVCFVLLYLRIPERSMLALLSLPVHVWLIVVAVRALFSRSYLLLQRIVISRLLSVSFAAAASLMVAGVFGFGALSQYWFDRDVFMKLTPEKPSMIPYEFDVAQEVRRETLEVLGSR